MGLRPTHRDENPHRRRPRAGGDPFRLDSRLRGNDESGRDFQESEAKDLLFSVASVVIVFSGRSEETPLADQTGGR